MLVVSQFRTRRNRVSAEAAAPIVTSGLGTFEGYPVTRTTIKLTKAGDGLSEAMKIVPQILHQTEKLYVVVECEVGQVTHKLADEQQTRIHTLIAGTAVIVDEALVKDMVEAQRERNLKAKEAAAGLRRLPSMGDLSADHDGGLHETDKEPGCPGCEAELSGKAPASPKAKKAKKEPADEAPKDEVKAKRERKKAAPVEATVPEDAPPDTVPDDAERAGIPTAG